MVGRMLWLEIKFKMMKVRVRTELVPHRMRSRQISLNEKTKV